VTRPTAVGPYDSGGPLSYGPPPSARYGFAPARPDGVDERNWIRTTADKGWFAILRLYGPEQPPFLDRGRLSSEMRPTG
jgi:uncharacterized protein DUF1214